MHMKPELLSNITMHSPQNKWKEIFTEQISRIDTANSFTFTLFVKSRPRCSVLQRKIIVCNYSITGNNKGKTVSIIHLLAHSFQDNLLVCFPSCINRMTGYTTKYIYKRNKGERRENVTKYP